MSNPASPEISLEPARALERLRDGNRRFIEGVRSVESMLSHMRMRDLAENGQKPFAIVLTCSDSRSPAEVIFDQGVGELFVIRVAGNVVAPSLLASIEFAAANFGSSIILVLGHTRCGAINAAVEHVKNPADPLPSPHLEELIARITPAVERTRKRVDLADAAFHQEATGENVRRSMRLIVDQSAIVRELRDAGKLAVVGGILDIHSGTVRFYE